MENSKKMTTLALSFAMVVVMFMLTIASVYAWFNGQGYIGKTMSYSRQLYIGTVDSNVTNNYGYEDESQNFVYAEIDPAVGFQQNNLIPGSFIHIRSDIQNTSTTDNLIVSLYLQNVVYDAPLHDYLYFGITDPVITRGIYKTSAEYDSQADNYTLRSIPLIASYTIAPSSTLEVYWYMYIDSDAGNPVASANIDFGNVALVYN